MPWLFVFSGRSADNVLMIDQDISDVLAILHPNDHWNPQADRNGDLVVDLHDALMLAEG